MLGILHRPFTRPDPLETTLYHVRTSTLEYAVQAWNPHLMMDIRLIENVKHRAKKMSQGLKHLPYNERCRQLGLHTLEKRRIKGDLIQRFKFEKGIQSIERHFSPLTGARTRNHWELVKNCDQRFHFFNNLLTNIWNWLPKIVIRADSVNQFKNRLNKICHKRPINLN